jgi:hypothetical protein
MPSTGSNTIDSLIPIYRQKLLLYVYQCDTASALRTGRAEPPYPDISDHDGPHTASFFVSFSVMLLAQAVKYSWLASRHSVTPGLFFHALLHGIDARRGAASLTSPEGL